MKLNKEEIIKKYPSICYTCSIGRHLASDELMEKGYTGCCLRLIGRDDHEIKSYDYDQILEAKEIAEGWVRTKVGIFKHNKNSNEIAHGLITNFQLITKGVTKCLKHTKIEDI